MFTLRLLELFQDDSGRLSMSRFAVFCTLPPAIWIVLHDYDKLDIFLGAFVINYGIGKVTDAMGSRNVGNTPLEVLEASSDTTVSVSSVATRSQNRNFGLRKRSPKENS